MLEKSHSRSSELSVTEGAEGGSMSMVGAAVSGSHGGWLPLAASEVGLGTLRCTASGMNVGEMARAGE